MQQCAQLQRFANRARRLRHRAAHVRQGASARHPAHARANHRWHRRPRFFGPGRIVSFARNARPACAFAHLPTTNTRVNHPVKNIRNQVSAEHKHGRNHGDACQKGRISAEASRNRRLAQTGIRKNLLDKNRTAENLRDRGELQRHRWQQQIAHAVAAHDLPRRQTTSTGKLHIIGFKNIDELLARMQRDVRHAHKRKHNRGQHDMVGGIEQRHIGRRFPERHRKAQREPAQPYRKHHEGHKPQPKRRRRGEHEAIAFYQSIGPPIAIGPRDHAEQQAEHAACGPRNAQKRQRVRCTVGQHFHHRGVEAQRSTPISLQNGSKPTRVALKQRRAHAPVLGELRPLGFAHRHIGRLAYVHLNGIDGRSRHEREHDEAHREHERSETNDLF